MSKYLVYVSHTEIISETELLLAVSIFWSWITFIPIHSLGWIFFCWLSEILNIARTLIFSLIYNEHVFLSSHLLFNFVLVCLLSFPPLRNMFLSYVFEWIDSVEYSTGRYVPFWVLDCSLGCFPFFLDQISKGSSFLFSRTDFHLMVRWSSMSFDDLIAT